MDYEEGIIVSTCFTSSYVAIGKFVILKKMTLLIGLMRRV